MHEVFGGLQHSSRQIVLLMLVLGGVSLCACFVFAAEAPESVNPWYAAYQAEFLRLLQFTDHETLDHPVAGAAGYTSRCICCSRLHSCGLEVRLGL